jgi:hypothetical protein
MAIVDPITRDRILSFMAKVAAFHKAKAENPDLEGLLKSIERLGRTELVDLPSGILFARHFSTAAWLANRKVFGLSPKQQSAVCNLYWTGLNSDLGGRSFHRSTDAFTLLDPNYGDRIYALGLSHASRIRQFHDTRSPTAREVSISLRETRNKLRLYRRDLLTKPEPAGMGGLSAPVAPTDTPLLHPSTPQ